ncbi:14322_t:CDS:2 [Gigaspora margarita]|uniref:14322_t:CDS:1 n=1 Tax=Gigaspora margarita TaxID=4874 RepID=A0ABM8W261_GIGMA|nr:14322_t:CDS:2 [Gigaspora margarita]
MTCILIKNDNPDNPTNALAVCNWCIAKNGSLEATKIKPECCTSNRGRLCQNHLSKYGDELYQVSDEDSNEINSKDNNEVIIGEEEQRWDQLIQEWINLEIQENQFDNQDDQIFISSEWDSDFNFANHEVHPADDYLAKWSLETLFVFSLEAPSFLGSDLIFTDAK